MPKKYIHKKGWKQIQSKRQTFKRTKLALTVFVIIFSLLLLSQVIKFTQMLFNPWKETTLVKRTILWNGDFNLNIIIKAKTDSLLSFNPKEHTVTIVNVPQNLYLEVAHGFGKWQMSSVFGLGESGKNAGGGMLVKDTLEDFFGVPVDGFLQLSDKYSQKDATQVVSEIRKNPFAVISVLPYLKTNLTPFELIRFNIGLSRVRFDKIRQLNLEEYPNLLQKDQLLDGTEIQTTDTVKLDSILSTLIDSAIELEHKTIAIFNSTNHPLLAQKAARMITNIGGDVIITSNGQNQLQKTQISGEKSKSKDRLKQIFQASDIIDPQDWDVVSSRAQINLFLGEDYFDRL